MVHNRAPLSRGGAGLGTLHPMTIASRPSKFLPFIAVVVVMFFIAVYRCDSSCLGVFAWWSCLLYLQTTRTDFFVSFNNTEAFLCARALRACVARRRLVSSAPRTRRRVIRIRCIHPRSPFYHTVIEPFSPLSLSLSSPPGSRFLILDFTPESR